MPSPKATRRIPPSPAVAITTLGLAVWACSADRPARNFPQGSASVGGSAASNGTGGGSVATGGSDAGNGGKGGQASPALCAENEKVSANSCLPCPAGSFSEAGADPTGDDTTCELCPSATFDPGDHSCQPCPAGSVSDAGASSCTPCQAGSFESENVCTPCPQDFNSSEGATQCTLEPAVGYLDSRDYGYLYWPGNHWTKWKQYFNVQHVKTGFYGLGIDVSAGSFKHLGILENAPGVEASLQSSNQVIQSMPEGLVEYAVIENSNTVRVATQFLNTDSSPSNPSELIDMGRFMQRIRVPQLKYDNAPDFTGSLQLAALPRYFVLTQRVSSSTSKSTLSVRIQLGGKATAQYPNYQVMATNNAVRISDANGKGWVFVIPEAPGQATTISKDVNGGLRFENSFTNLNANQSVGLSVYAIPSTAATAEQVEFLLNPEKKVQVEYAQLNRDGTGGTTLNPAKWDTERGTFLVPLGNLMNVGAPEHPNWQNPSHHNWYNRHRLRIQHNLNKPVSVPVAFDGGRNAAFYITGGSPLLRSTKGEPVGVPVQISKNWHEKPYWYHLYSCLEVQPGSHEFEHTFAHSKWGNAYAAQHAQLSLIGLNYNQQWDESSLGAWGESVTYDPDMTFGRSTVDDVRPFLVNTKGEYKWTGNVGGASFLVYAPKEGYSSFPSHQLGRMRTHYAYTGPNLTHVTYSGLSRDGKIEATVTTQLGRTDDLVRVYYHLHYKFLDTVNYNRLALFQVAADRYGDNEFTWHAYGNESTDNPSKVDTTKTTTGYELQSERGIPLPGKAPWVMLYANTRTDGDLPENLANVGFIVRDYKAVIGTTTTTTPHINIVRTNNLGYSQRAFELGIPYVANAPTVPKGSEITATVEYVVPPSEKLKYFGKSDYLSAMPASDFNTPKMMIKLAKDNRLEVVATVGSVVRQQPVEIDTVAEQVAAEFTLTGGLGYVPLVFHKLVRPDGWRLEIEVNGQWSAVDQSVEGNDFWQAYEDATTKTYDLIFNVPNRGTNTYRLVR